LKQVDGGFWRRPDPHRNFSHPDRSLKQTSA
jgi:hypothetical protein